MRNKFLKCITSTKSQSIEWRHTVHWQLTVEKKEEILRVSIEVPIEKATIQMEYQWVPRNFIGPSVEQVKLAITDSYKRLIQPSIERELRGELTAKAETQAIHIFSENLRNLLLQPPMRGKFVLGVDPAYKQAVN